MANTQLTPGQQAFNSEGEVIGTIADDAGSIVPSLAPVVTDAKSLLKDGVSALKPLRAFANSNALGFNTRSLEKLIAYGAATVGATNGFAQVAMPSSLRETLIGISGLVLLALHVSG